MSYLPKLLPYVRHGTTEGDRNFLNEVFVTPAQLASICGVEPGSMRVLVGNKGAGKSALTEWLKKAAVESKTPCVLVRPDQLVGTGVPTATDLATLKRFFYETLLRSVAIEIGSQINSYLPLTGSRATLYNEAVAGGASGDIVSKAVSLIGEFAEPVTKIDTKKLLSRISGRNSSAALTSALNDHLLNKSEKLFLLLIDDTDQIAAPDDRQQLNKIWALILAVRRLAMECNAVRPIVTLRSSVWSRLMHENAGQRDQVDHIRPLTVQLRASDEVIVQIIERRMREAMKTVKVPALSAYAPFFEGRDVLLPGSKQRRLWSDFIAKSARERPRDALQLIKSMIEVAEDNTHPKIGDDDADRAMSIYSSERVDDVANEYSLDLPSVRELIDSFHSSNFEMGFEQLRDHLARSLGIAQMQLRGSTLQNRDDHIIALLALLHEVGFVNARIVDKTKPKGFAHKNYSDDPKFVRYENWNNLQAAHWEIHPAFRSHLLNVKDAKARATR